MMHKCLEGDNDYGELVSPYSNRNSWKTPCRCSTLTDNDKKSSAFSFLTKSDSKKLFCHNDLFNYMNSRKTLTLKSIQMDSISSGHNQLNAITSLHLYDDYEKDLVLILSNSNAQIQMYTFDIEANLAQQYDQINLLLNSSIAFSASSASKISLNVLEDENHDQKYLYATYDRFLYKINMKNCGQFETCDKCMNGDSNGNKLRNPFCGWCVYEQKCMQKSECLTLKNRQIFLEKNDQCPFVKQTSPSKYLNPFVLTKRSDIFQFKLNMNLSKSDQIGFYCDLTVENTTVNRVEAKLADQTTLNCDLNQIKPELEELLIQKPIRSKILNVSLAIKAKKSSQVINGDQTASLIAHTNLYAFNCSYLKDCGECLSKSLMGGCVWCAKNSKCIFASESSKQNAQCPNEIDFYSRINQESEKDFCTSFSMTNKKSNQDDTVKIDIAYSSDSNLAQLTTLSIKNAKEYQKEFICLFTKTKHFDIKSLEKFTKTSLIWTNTRNEQENRTKFDCIYSPYTDIEQIDPKLPLQTVYMSVWWSPNDFNPTKKSQLSNFYQIKLKQPKLYHLLNEFGEKIENEIDDHHENELDLNVEDMSDLNDNFIEINIINCKVQASSCGQCMDEKLLSLGCGWCKSNSKCTMKKDCPNYGLSWLNDLDESNPFNYCPNPIITQLSPKCAPKKLKQTLTSSSTQLVLLGENLGRTEKDIRVRLRPLNQNNYGGNKFYPELNCDILNYTKAFKIVCKIDHVKNLNNQPYFDSFDEFSVYVETNINSISQIYSTLNQSSQFTFKYTVSNIKTYKFFQ